MKIMRVMLSLPNELRGMCCILTGPDVRLLPPMLFLCQDLPVLLARELIPQVPPEVYIRDDAEGSSSSSSLPSSPTSSCSEFSPTQP